MSNILFSGVRLGDEYRSSIRHRIVIIGAVFAVLLAAFQVIGFGGAVNSGDYSRVFQSMSIAVPGWLPLSEYYPLLRDRPITAPESTMAAIGWGVAKLFAMSQQAYFPTWALALVLFAIYVGGVVGLARRGCWRSDIALLLSILTFVAFGFYFRSLYEEAALLAFAPLLAFCVAPSGGRACNLVTVVVSVLIILAKAEMVFLLPLLIYNFSMDGAPKWANRCQVFNAAALVFVAAGYAGYLAAHGGMGPVNNYNRFYNGIGYSALSSAAWPAHTFNERLAYFQSHRERFDQEIRAIGLPFAEGLWGTSYWPVGAEISKQAWGAGVSGETKERVLGIVNNGGLRGYVFYLMSHPWTIMSVITNSLLTSISSDYSLTYIRNPAPKAWSRAWVSIGVARYFFQISVLLICACMLLKRSWGGWFVGIYFVLGAPVFVVIGDGYFEFEKHMVPMLMLLPFVVSLILRDRSHWEATRGLVEAS